MRTVWRHRGLLYAGGAGFVLGVLWVLWLNSTSSDRVVAAWRQPAAIDYGSESLAPRTTRTIGPAGLYAEGWPSFLPNKRSKNPMDLPVPIRLALEYIRTERS
jgi:hypothetical protein